MVPYELYEHVSYFHFTCDRIQYIAGCEAVVIGRNRSTRIKGTWGCGVSMRIFMSLVLSRTLLHYPCSREPYIANGAASSCDNIVLELNFFIVQATPDIWAHRLTSIRDISFKYYKPMFERIWFIVGFLCVALSNRLGHSI